MGQAVDSGRSVLALQIIEGAEDAFVAFDAQFRVTFANPAAEQLLGRKEAELVGRPAGEAFPATGGLPLEAAYRRAMDERVTVNLRSLHEALRKWFDVQASPSPDGGLLVRFRDLAGRMRAEEAVRDERQRFSDVLDQLPAYLVLLSPDYHVPFANRFFRERFGESNGRRCYEYLFQRTEPCEICETYKVLKTGAPHRWEWTGPDQRNYDIYDFPFADVDGSKLIMEVGLDITERKQAEAAQREAGDRYLSLFNSMDAGFCVVEVKFDEAQRPLDYRFFEVNPAFERQTGLTEAEGRWMRSLAPAHEQHWFDIYGAVALTGEPVRFENPAAALDDRWYEVYAFRVDKPEARRVAILFNDITARKRADAEIAKHREHLEELVKERTSQLEASNARLQAEIAERKRAEARLAADLSDNARAQMALRVSEERHRVLADLLQRADQPFGVGYVDGTLGFVNPAFERLTGYSRDELNDIDWASALTPPEWREVEAAKLDELHCTGRPVRYEKEYLRKDGTRVPVELLVHLMKDDRGRPLHYYSFITDLTERKKAEGELRRLAQFPEENPNPVLRVATDGSLLYANAPARAWLASLDWADGRPLPSAVEALVSDACGRKQPAEAEIDDFHGRTVWFGAMQPAGETYVNIYGRDITERKAAEARILHQHEVLEGINRVLHEALASDTEEKLGHACLTVAEEVTQSEFGFLAEIKADGRLADIAISDPGWEACRMQNTGKLKAPGGFEIHGLYGRVLLDGKGFFTNNPPSHPDSIATPEGHPPLKAFLGVPLKHEGKTIGMIAVANREGGYRSQDLEAMEALALAIVQVFLRKRAEQAVRAGEERLRQAQKMESIGVLAGGIAHDFNNLLTGIMGNASLLRDEVFGESRDTLDGVIRASERAADLTRQLLAYAGKGRFFIEPLDLARMAVDVTDLLRASLPKKVELRLATEPDLPGIEADRGQVQQIVMNLVINGAEAIGTNQIGTVMITTKAATVSEADRISNAITGESLAPGEYVCLEVEDNGCGMDKETRTKIFDPFFTTKFLGRGLGLAAVAGIVQAQHGAIQLETEPGKGTIFRVFLPAVGAPDAPRPANQTADLRGSGTVLLVDDEAVVRDFARAALERRGYQVMSANDGQEAVRTFEENAERIGLVLLDLTMPVMGGDEVIGLLKSRRADVRVIVMSGYGESEARRMFAGKGASGFLQKPFTAARLAEETKAVLADAAEKRSV